MKMIIFLILSIGLLACQNGSFNDPTSSDVANRSSSFKTCSELFTMPDGTINDTTNVMQEYRFHGNLKDTSDIQPHEYLDSTGKPFNCPSGAILRRINGHGMSIPMKVAIDRRSRSWNMVVLFIHSRSISNLNRL